MGFLVTQAKIVQKFEFIGHISQEHVKKLDQKERGVLLKALQIMNDKKVTITDEEMNVIEDIGKKLHSEYAPKPDKELSSSFIKALLNRFGDRISPKRIVKEYNRKGLPRRAVLAPEKVSFEEQTKRLESQKNYIVAMQNKVKAYRNELGQVLYISKNPQRTDLARNQLEGRPKFGPGTDPERLPQGMTVEHIQCLSCYTNEKINEINDAIKDLLQNIKDNTYDQKKVAEQIQIIRKMCDFYDQDLKFFMEQWESKNKKLIASQT